jgi:hypothetical protein
METLIDTVPVTLKDAAISSEVRGRTAGESSEEASGDAGNFALERRNLIQT